MAANRSARRPRNGNATPKGGASPVSQTATPKGEGSTWGKHIAFPVTHSPADAGSRERKQSALVGVDYAARGRDEAWARFLREGFRLEDAVVSARDEGATVQEIAEQMGVSRQAVYSLMARIRRRREKR